MGTCALVGAAEFNAQHFRSLYDADRFDYVVAVDGGYEHLKALSVYPDMAIGDFDSLGYSPSARQVSELPEKKDRSDMEAAMERAIRKHHELYVYGALSNRLDHTVANLQLFAGYSERGYYVTGIGDTYAVRFLTGPDVFDIPYEGFGTVSVFAASEICRGVIERGLEYCLEDEVLHDRTSRGLSNELIGEPAMVAVEEGTLMIFYPLEPEQVANPMMPMAHVEKKSPVDEIEADGSSEPVAE